MFPINILLKSHERPAILFNLSGHGLVDIANYDSYFAGDIQ